MGWQDDIRAIDARLARGEITGADHRRMRDEILAAASSSPSLWSPDGTPRAASAVSRPMPLVLPQTPPPAPGAPPAADRAPSAGVEIFTARPARGKLTGAVIALIALVVVSVGIWLFLLNDGDSPDAAPPPVRQLETLVAEIGATPGEPNVNNGTLSLDQAVGAKVVSPAEADLFRELGVTRLGFLGSTGGADGSTGYSVLIAEFAGPEQATAAVGRQRELLVDEGFRAGAADRLTRESEQSTIHRAVYGSGQFTVRVGASRAAVSGTEGLDGEFASVLSSVTAVVPAS